MIIPLDENLRIVGGEMAWEVQRRRTVKGRERWESTHWFGRLGHALEWAGQTEIRLSEGGSLADALEAFSRVAHRYEQLLDGVLSEVSRKFNKIERRVA